MIGTLRLRGIALALAVILGANACTVGPNYVKPVVLAPEAFKETADWKFAAPADDVLRGDWWTRFGDAELTGLEEQVSAANQTLVAAEATYRQARALVAQTRSAYFPTVTIGAGYARSRAPSNFSAPFGGVSNGSSSGSQSTFQLPIDASWTIDFWGRVRRAVESSRASAQATAGDRETARLSLQTELALDYFQLRTLEAQKRLLDDTVAAFQRSLELTQNRYASGVASQNDVVQAKAQRDTTRAQSIDVGVQRAQLEHAIAVLIGQPASTFTLPPGPIADAPPAIPIGVPSQLLERRPDIAAAERRVAAANAEIGVAIAAFYPTVTLSASAGFQSGSLAQWLAWPSRFWSVGPGISETVFDGGLRRAQTAEARAAYDASVANYRQTVLTAFQGVEDSLAALRILEEEAQVEAQAIDSATRSVDLTTSQYKAGIVSYLNVITAQTIALSDRLTAVQILGRRMTAAVLLIQSLGGGWNASELPTARDVTPDR